MSAGRIPRGPANTVRQEAPVHDETAGSGMNRGTVGKLAGHVSVVFTVKQYFKLLGDHDAAAARVYA